MKALFKKFSNLFLFATLIIFLFQEQEYSSEERRPGWKEVGTETGKEKARQMSASTYKLHLTPSTHVSPKDLNGSK